MKKFSNNSMVTNLRGDYKNYKREYYHTVKLSMMAQSPHHNPTKPISTPVGNMTRQQSDFVFGWVWVIAALVISLLAWLFNDEAILQWLLVEFILYGSLIMIGAASGGAFQR